MQQQAIKRIVIIGPESTGKSTLTEQLAAHFNTLACPEYAREYLMKNGTDYSFDDLQTIAKGQLHLEDAMAQKVAQKSTSNMLFIDTDMYVMKVWCEYVFGKCHQYILDEIVARKYDLYLFCNIDLPWVKDELREYPDEQPRIELYNIYKDILANQNTAWASIHGTYNERLSLAINAVEKYIFKQP